MEAAIDGNGKSTDPQVLRKGRFARNHPGAWSTAVWCFVALGIAVRLVRYLVNYPIWHDEAFLAVNLWDRDYIELLRPLDYGQIAPWLFLAIERTAVVWLGYCERVLRFFPTLCSLLSVPLFAYVSSRILPARARLFSVAVFAVSFYSIRHGAEIKPYASDLLAALVLLALALVPSEQPRGLRRWLLLTAVVPFCIALSYPAVFVAGGISLALSPGGLRSLDARIRLGCIAFNLVLVASFLSIYQATAALQAESMRAEYRFGVWAEAFPPLSTPWAVPLWLLDVHTGVMMAYPVGDRHGGSILSLVCAIAGGLVLYQRRQRTLLAVLVAPFGLGLVAAALGRYPYGGAPRVMQYLAPSICLLMGQGMTVLLAQVPGRLHRSRVALGLLLALGLLGGALIGRDLIKPYRVIEDVQTREFARWFWTEKARNAEVACLKSDCALSFRTGLWRSGMSAVYLFHQRMFSARHAQRKALRLAELPSDGVCRLNLVSFDHLPEGIPTFDLWLAKLPGLSLQRTESYLVQPGKPGEDWLRDEYHVIELAVDRRRPMQLAAGQRSNAQTARTD
jgi:hypothetical protein